MLHAGPAGNQHFKHKIILQPSKSLNLPPDHHYNPASIGNEYTTTPEKKAKFNAMAKDLATKLAFKNLKSQIYKCNEAGEGTSTKNSSNAHSGNSSEGEITASTSGILTIN